VPLCFCFRNLRTENGFFQFNTTDQDISFTYLCSNVAVSNLSPSALLPCKAVYGRNKMSKHLCSSGATTNLYPDALLPCKTVYTIHNGLGFLSPFNIFKKFDVWKCKNYKGFVLWDA
jgi:hypothetical protein